MKLWEVMRLLEEDPSRKFEYQDNQKKWILYADAGCYDDRVFYMLECFEDIGELKTGYRVGSIHGTLSTLDNWQPVRQPVTWQEAIQAWADGKLVYAKNKAGGRVYRRGGEGEKMYLLSSEITTGIWYVED